MGLPCAPNSLQISLPSFELWTFEVEKCPKITEAKRRPNGGLTSLGKVPRVRYQFLSDSQKVGWVLKQIHGAFRCSKQFFDPTIELGGIRIQKCAKFLSQS